MAIPMIYESAFDMYAHTVFVPAGSNKNAEKIKKKDIYNEILMKNMSILFAVILLSILNAVLAGTKEDESIAITLEKCQKLYDQNPRIIYSKDKDSLEQVAKLFWNKMVINYNEDDIVRLRKAAILSVIFGEKREISDQYKICRDFVDIKR